MARKKDEKKEVKSEALKAMKYTYRVTEKSARLGNGNIYVLNLKDTTINKIDLKKDIETTYKVTVLDIQTVKVPAKKVMRAQRLGTKKAGKKAYITLKKGDAIAL